MSVVKKTSILFITVLAMSVAMPAFAQYTPMVRIPGLTASGSINLSMYLVGLYNFMVSIVGIVAVMMMIVGGMRYITAAGSSTAISDAKDIISNAVAGLVIAIFAWIIVAAINPDVLFIKKPGSGFNNASYLSCTKQYTAAICKCNDDVGLGVFATPTACNDACKAGNHCGGLANNCIRDGVNETTSPKFNTAPNNGKCLCVDGGDVVPIPPATCQATCATNNCFIADFRVGRMNVDGNSLPTDGERAKKYAINVANTADNAYDITFSLANPYSCFIAVNAKDFVSSYPAINSMILTRGSSPGPGRFDMNCAEPSALNLLTEPSPGYFGPTLVPFACPLGALNTVYGQWEADPNCRKIKDPEGVVCPIKLCVQWNGGAIQREKIMYVKMYNVY